MVMNVAILFDQVRLRWENAVNKNDCNNFEWWKKINSDKNITVERALIDLFYITSG